MHLLGVEPNANDFEVTGGTVGSGSPTIVDVIVCACVVVVVAGLLGRVDSVSVGIVDE